MEQKYIEKPLLYKNRKFDIRVWALITWQTEVYYYEKGYIRTSSIDFSLNSKYNYVHLTNNCLQQFGDYYGKHEEGNTLSFEELQQYLDIKYPDIVISVKEHIIPRIKDLIIDTILAVQNNSKLKQRNFFELLGYDFMIDEDFRVWLIEVNTNPYLGIPNEFIKEILPSMIDEMFSIVLDKIFPCDFSNYSFFNYFDLIYNPGKINVRRSYSKDLLYPINCYKQKTSYNRIPRQYIFRGDKFNRKLELSVQIKRPTLPKFRQ